MDHVSNLPDEVICHILSFLTTKETALTSVLSKRWLNLWALVPKLDIDDSVFLHPEEGKRERDGVLQSFMDFVDNALGLQGDFQIKKFSLKVKTGIDTDRVDRWICNVLQRGVSHLELFLDFPEEYVLPKEVFVTKTLIKLKLKTESAEWLCSGTITFLPMLKALYMESDKIVLHTQLEMFLHALPVLEELYIFIIEWCHLDETVSSASLKKLTIYATGLQDLENPKSISFDTPSLVYLGYSDFVAADYPKVNLTNLVVAQLDLKVTRDQLELIRAPDDEDDVFLRLRNVSKLINGIRNVQQLFFTADTLEVLSLCCESMPVFNNLKYLRIKSDKEHGWQAMPVLLKNCPHLETLVLEGLLHFKTDKCGDACDCITREDKGRSLICCPVKKLEINGFRGTTKESGMIRHFMDSFPCLKEMEVYAEENDPTIFEIPEIIEKVAQMLYKEFLSYDVMFSVYTPLYENSSEE